jgi:maleylacetoacetate isomerase/maleylpyruvate isomerase
VRDGLEAFERQLAQLPPSTYCHGNTPTMADCCLVPQIFSAQRFNVDLSAYPTLMAIFDACQAMPAFTAAQPSQQDDAE